MKIDVTKTIDDFDGNPFPINPDKPEGPKMMLADVMSTVLMAAAHPPGSEYSAKQAVERYDLALTVHKARKDDADPEVEVSAEMAAAIKAGVNRMYGPVVSGQVMPLFDGK